MIAKVAVPYTWHWNLDHTRAWYADAVTGVVVAEIALWHDLSPTKAGFEPDGIWEASAVNRVPYRYVSRQAVMAAVEAAVRACEEP